MASRTGDVEGIRSALSSGASALEEGSLALYFAVVEKQEASIRELAPISDAKRDNSFALRYSLREGLLDLSRFLLPLSDVDKARGDMEFEGDAKGLLTLDTLLQEMSLMSSHSCGERSFPRYRSV